MQSIWQALAVHGIGLVGSLLMAVVTYLIHKYFKNQSMDDILDKALATSIAWAEEQGRKALNDGKPLESKTKLDMAASMAMDMLDNSGYEKMAQDKLEALIEAKLGGERAAPNGVVPSDVPPPSSSSDPAMSLASVAKAKAKGK